jgi:hypothetical protein
MNLSRARRFVYFGLGLALAGAAVMAWTVRRHAGADLPVPAELTVFAAFVVGGSGLLVAFVGWRTLRLGSAAQAIAAWVVSEAEWRRYEAACRMRETMPGALPGAVPLDMPVPPQGIEVLALRRGFRIGESFHEIGTLGAEVMDIRVVDSPAPMFEFNMIYATGRTSSVRLGVRIPTAGADVLANQVEDYWTAREPLQVMTVDELRRRERAGWTLAVLGFVAFLGVIALFIVINPPGWAAIGPIGTLGLAGWGFFRALRARTVRWSKESRAAEK